MISLSKVRSFAIEQGRRILKVQQYGAKTAVQSSSFGDDSAPLPNTSAIYAETQENGEPVIIGYINTNQLAAVGEKRIYSVNSEGNVVAFVWCKADGSLELNGNSSNAVKYQELDSALQAMVALVNAELTKVQTGLQSV